MSDLGSTCLPWCDNLGVTRLPCVRPFGLLMLNSLLIPALKHAMLGPLRKTCVMAGSSPVHPGLLRSGPGADLGNIGLLGQNGRFTMICPRTDSLGPGFLPGFIRSDILVAPAKEHRFLQINESFVFLTHVFSVTFV